MFVAGLYASTVDKRGPVGTKAPYDADDAVHHAGGCTVRRGIAALAVHAFVTGS